MKGRVLALVFINQLISLVCIALSTAQYNITYNISPASRARNFMID